MANMKNSGEWITYFDPFLRGEKKQELLLINTESLTVEMLYLIHFIHLSPNPIFLKRQNTYSRP